MNTILGILVMVYMIINVITDFVKLKTYNKWHLLHVITIFLYAIIVGRNYINIIVSLIISLLLGIVLSKIPHNQLGAGDIKMLVIISMYLSLNQSLFSLIFLVLKVYFFYMIFALVIMVILKLFINSENKEWRFGGYLVKKSYMVTPEAIPIFMSIITIIFLKIGG